MITGANGFIARNLTKGLSEKYKGHNIYCIVRNKKISIENKYKNLYFINHDLLNGELPEGLPGRIDIIFHLAAISKTFLKDSEARKQFIENVTITSNIINIADKLSSRKIIFSSSVYVYSGTDSKPFSENMILSPNEYLGTSKLASELLLKSYSISSAVDVYSLRLFTVYGPGSRKNQFIPEAIRKIKDPKITASFGNPNVTRDFVYVSDVVKAFLLTLDSNEKGFTPINIASGETMTISETVKIIKKVAGVKKSIKFEETNTLKKQGDSDHSANIDLSEEILGWKPETSFKKGITETIKDYS
jgi:UDP-glucose 4-epimerase